MFLEAKKSAEERQGAADGKFLGISSGKMHQEMHSLKKKKKDQAGAYGEYIGV